MAQSQRIAAEPDPYTRGEAHLLAKAGYENLGPFAFGTDQTTQGIEELLGTEPLRWIETKHFRIGCSLAAVACSGREEWRKDWLAQIRRELLELQGKLPSVKKRPKVLDPWLRAHLYAHRLEKLYSEVSDVLGVDDAWFPTRRGDAFAPKEYRGQGPFFGMTEKFTVLLVQTGASHARYMRAYQGIDMSDPMRCFDSEFGCAYWGASEETANGLFRNDHALHANVVFNVAHNLYTCFRGLGHELPPWVATGLGHWHARKITPRFPTYDRKNEHDRNPRSTFWAWQGRVHGLVANRGFEALDTFMDRQDAGVFGLEQQIQSWALVDYLLTHKRSQARNFLHLLKEPILNRRRTPTAHELQVHQRESLIQAFDCDVEDLEAEWHKHVLTHKPRYARRHR